MENKNELIVVLESHGVVLTEAQSLITAFTMHKDNAERLIEEAKSITVVDENDTVGMDRAREVRLALKDVRVEAEKDRKHFKEDSVKRGRAIDKVAGVVSDLIEPEEERLENLEKTALHIAMKKKEEADKARFEGRMSRLQGLNPDPAHDYRNMSDDAFEGLVVLLQTAKKMKEEQEAREKAENERLAKEKAIEDERVRLENETLKKEQEEKDRLHKEELAKLAEAKRIEDEKRAEEKKIADKLVEEAMKAEREAREVIERELKAKEEAERAEKKRIEDERLAKEQEEKAKALAPDKEKLFAFAEEIRNVKVPTGLSEISQKIAIEYSQKLLEITATLKKIIETL